MPNDTLPATTPTADTGHALTVLAPQVRPSDDHDQGQDYPGVIFIRTEYLDTHRRWAVDFLDVYLHAASGTYAGIEYSVPATEMQEQDANPQVVPVEVDPTPRFRVRRAPRQETPR